MNMLRKGVIFFIILSFCSCSTPYKRKYKTRKVKFEQTSFSQIYGWRYDNHLTSLKVFKNSCEKINQLSPNSPISSSTSVGGKASSWQSVCRALDRSKIKNNYQAKKFFERWFKPYKVYDSKGSSVGKFTGYYEISMYGNKRKTRRFRHPVYKPPANLNQIKRSHRITHAAINNGSLRGKGLEIAWVDNLARLHWMQIQGSGIIKLPRGKSMRVGYAGQNGHDYTSVGPYFKKYNAKGIRSGLDMIEWVHRNPRDGKKIIEINKSYVFFREVNANGPLGTQGVPLVAERSVAIDKDIYPFGMPVWVDTNLPYSRNYVDRNYRRLLIAQDKGGAIKGPIRADIFFGHGKRAEELACYMNDAGKMYVMFPKTVRIPRQYSTK